jgi:hypothetical protein
MFVTCAFFSRFSGFLWGLVWVLFLIWVVLLLFLASGKGAKWLGMAIFGYLWRMLVVWRFCVVDYEQLSYCYCIAQPHTLKMSSSV